MAILLAILLLLIGLLLFKGPVTLHERLFPRLYNRVEFPEDRFLPVDPERYFKNVAAGYAKMKDIKVVICGLTKDDAAILPLTIARIEKTGGFFSDYRAIVYENDSCDHTLSILKEWQAANPRVHVLTESIVGTPLLQLGRTERLAHFRNRYLQHLSESGEYTGCDYVLVVDMDLKGGWSNDGIAASFARSDWDIVAANSIGYHYLRKSYYDTFALVPKTILKTGLLYRIIGEGWQLRRGDPLIPIQSGFGGLALYRKEVLLSRRYSGTQSGEPVCEHTSLNADYCLRCFLNPSQMTITGTQEEKKYNRASTWVNFLHRLFLNW